MNETKLAWEEGLFSLDFQTQWHSGSFLNYTLLISHSPFSNCLTCSYSKRAVRGFKIEDTTFRKILFFPQNDMIVCLQIYFGNSFQESYVHNALAWKIKCPSNMLCFNKCHGFN